MPESLDMIKLIRKKQFDFQKQRSCLITIIALTEKLNHYVEEKHIVSKIFLDLAKAFISISLDNIIQKIEKYGFGRKHNILIEFVSV